MNQAALKARLPNLSSDERSVSILFIFMWFIYCVGSRGTFIEEITKFHLGWLQFPAIAWPSEKGLLSAAIKYLNLADQGHACSCSALSSYRAIAVRVGGGGGIFTGLASALPGQPSSVEPY